MTTNRSLFSFVSTSLLVLACALSRVEAADATGTWKWTFTNANGDILESTLRLKQDGEKLTGVFVRNDSETPIQDGTAKNGRLNFKVTRERNGQKITTRHEGELVGDTIKGKIEFDRDGETRAREWEAKRVNAPSNATGNWVWAITRDDGEKMEFTLKLKQDGEKLMGTSVSPNGNETEITEGKVQDNAVSFKVIRERDGRTITTKFNGKLAGDSISGKVESDFSGESRSFDWNARRVKDL